MLAWSESNSYPAYREALCGFLMAAEFVKDRVERGDEPLDAERPVFRLDVLGALPGPECVEAYRPRRDCFCQDPATRQRILALRNDPNISAIQAQLRQKLAEARQPPDPAQAAVAEAVQAFLSAENWEEAHARLERDQALLLSEAASWLLALLVERAWRNDEYPG